jgi:tetratricopeptide (TPR) repeat protein
LTDQSRKALEGSTAAAFIAAAVAFAFLPAVHGGWLWDDPSAIAQNPALRDGAGLARIWTGSAGPDYLPLTSTVQWVQWHLWGARVEGYHLTNIALHLLGSLLLCRVLARLGAGAAALGGLLFAVHPLVVESVAWMSELKNVLSLPLLLLALLAFLRGEDSGGAPRRAFTLLSTALFTLAMLAKGSVVMFPAILLLHAWWRRGRIGWRDLAETAPFLAVSLVLGCVTVHFQAARAMARLPIPGEGAAIRIAAAGAGAWFYLWKALVPVGLLPIYPRWTAGAGLVAAGFAGWAAIAAAAAWFWSRRTGWGRHALLGFGSFLLNLAPALGLVPMAFLRISRVSDHFAYLALASVAGLAAAAAGRLRASMPRPILWACAGLLIAACAIASRRDAANFRSEEALWRHTLAGNPGAWLAENNLCIALAGSGRPGEAVAHGRAAVKLEPGFAETHANLGLALTQAGRPAEAIPELEEALRLNPDLAGARLGLAVAHNNRGGMRARSGRVAEAVGDFEAARELDPANAGIRRNLAYALHELGRDREALDQMNEADRLDSAGGLAGRGPR